MHKLTALTLSIIVALTVGVVSDVASASAEEVVFVGTSMSTISAEATETQVLKTSAGIVECSKLKVTSGTLPEELETEGLSVTIKYEGCTAFGFAAEISPVEYTFNSNESVEIDKPVTLTAGFGTCTVHIPAQTVSSVAYGAGTKEGHEAITLAPNVTGFTSSGEGTCAYASEKGGTYKGKSIAWLPGAELEVTKGLREVTLTPTAGGGELKFKGEPVKMVKEATAKNVGKNLIRLVSAQIQVGAVKEEAVFKIAKSMGNECVLPGELLIATKSCTIGVELVKVQEQEAELVLKYGIRGRLTARLAVQSKK